ncbi:hypothetical protein B0T26DRAFT_756217 [Lasiosphaeria miniovina]|uniref:Uncharacterized protein n=1 Tax=Lasiosphaeria miniovina TaxID=1954250 RepID=A0AA39ZZX4_9PEZI|nr:uncharacterized protein B0T26DRAFT_756217 [Lasiosphaeria miniovina]KAK0706757.1 hypothetical protein B0T26DRAFT_756217 [Lasiosphaeria miniovina]
MASSAAATTATTLYKPVLTRLSEWLAWYAALKKVDGDRKLGEAVDINNTTWLPLPELIFYDLNTSSIIANLKPHLASLKKSDIVRKLHTLVSMSKGEEVERAREAYTCPYRPDAAFHKPEKCWALQEVITGKKGRHNVPKKRLDYAREELKKPKWKELAQKIRKVSTTEEGEGWPKNFVAAIFTVNAVNYGPHPLSQSIIFDIGASIYVVNSKALLKPGTFTPSTDEDFIQVGDSYLAIEGRGTWFIKNALNGPNGMNTVDLTLEDMAVIAGFHVNIVSDTVLYNKAKFWLAGFDNTIRFGTLKKNKHLIAIKDEYSGGICVFSMAKKNHSVEIIIDFEAWVKR